MGVLLLFILLIIAIALTKLQVRFKKRKEGLFIFIIEEGKINKVKII